MENTQVGPFFILEKLGSHRRHQVYHARQTEQDRDVAIKFIKVPQDISTDTVLQKIQIESELLKGLSHPNLVKFYGAGVVDNRIFLASKLVKGESLSAMMTRRSRFAPDTVIEYAKQVASCLDYIHEIGLVHSKLTPDKILVDRRGVVRLIDVRLNRAKKRRWDAPRKHQLETAAYLAPELLMGKGATTRSDFYSLGVLMYEMLTGELPFEPETLSRLIRRKRYDRVSPITDQILNCPARLDTFVRQLLNPQPKSRPLTADDIVRELTSIRNSASQKTSTVQIEKGKIAEAESDTAIESPDQKARTSWFQSTPFVAACLAGFIGLMIYFAWPPSNAKLLERAEQLSDSQSVKDWKQAKNLYHQIIERKKNDDATLKAEERYYETLQQLLVNRAETGETKLESGAERSFIQGYQFEKEGRFELAASRYRKLQESVDATGEYQHVYREAKQRLGDLELIIARINKTTVFIDEQILAARKAKTENRYDQAREILEKIIDDFSKDSDLRHWIHRAKTELSMFDS